MLGAGTRVGPVHAALGLDWTGTPGELSGDADALSATIACAWIATGDPAGFIEGFFGPSIALGASFQALGRSLYSMITSIVRQLVFLIPIAYVLARYGASVGNSDLVWWSYPIAEVFSLTLTLFFFRHLYKTVIAQLPEGRE